MTNASISCRVFGADMLNAFNRALCFLILAGAAYANEIVVNIPKEFQASQHVVLSDGTAFHRQLFFKDEILRSQSTLDKGSFILLDTVKRHITCVFPNRKQYFAIVVQPYNNYNKMMDDTFLYLAPVSGEFLAREFLSGLECDKLQLSVNGNVLYLWIDSVRKLPKKLSSTTGATYIEWKTFVTDTPLNSTLFALPEGLTAIDVFSQAAH